MQDKSIDGALLALRKQGGAQGKIAEALLMMRDVRLTRLADHAQVKRGQMASFVLDALKPGPLTCPQIADRLALDMPHLSRLSLLQRVYTALRRLEDKGTVQRHGRVWGLSAKSKKVTYHI